MASPKAQFLLYNNGLLEARFTVRRYVIGSTFFQWFSNVDIANYLITFVVPCVALKGVILHCSIKKIQRNHLSTLIRF